MLRPEQTNILMGALEIMERDATFEQFPLHVTLQPWFSIGEDRRQVFDNNFRNFMYEQIQDRPPIAIVGGEEALFGPNQDVRVRRLAGDIGRLKVFHNGSADLIEQSGGELSNYVRTQYAPHVTYRGGKGLEEGERAVIPAIQWVELAESGLKKVVRQWVFPGAKR